MVLTADTLITYSIKILKFKNAGEIINRVFTIEEIENDGIASWLVNHGHYFECKGDLNEYIEILSRDIF